MEKDVSVTKEFHETVTKEKIIEYLNAFGYSYLTKHEQSQFIEIAQAYNLNPFKREIYCIPYNTKDGRKLSILTGYEVYLKRAERLKMLDGFRVWTQGDKKDNSLKAVIEIHRKDWKTSLTHEVYFNEYAQSSPLWVTKPLTMLKKVVIAQGFRLCFPDEMGGLPYTSDEIPEEIGVNTDTKEIVVDEKIEIVEKEKRPKEIDDETKKFITFTSQFMLSREQEEYINDLKSAKKKITKEQILEYKRSLMANGKRKRLLTAKKSGVAV